MGETTKRGSRRVWGEWTTRVMSISIRRSPHPRAVSQGKVRQLRRRTGKSSHPCAPRLTAWTLSTVQFSDGSELERWVLQSLRKTTTERFQSRSELKRSSTATKLSAWSINGD